MVVKAEMRASCRKPRSTGGCQSRKTPGSGPPGAPKGTSPAATLVSLPSPKAAPLTFRTVRGGKRWVEGANWAEKEGHL